MTLLRNGEKIDAGQEIRRERLGLGERGHRRAAGLRRRAQYIERMKTVRLEPNRHVKVLGADAAGLAEN